MTQEDKYLHLLSEKFPNKNAVVSELINLKSILSLPKGTEHFVSDLHGASSAFIHMVKNASGVVRRKVDDIYADTLSEADKRALCALIYYPDERIELVRKGEVEDVKDLNSWYRTRLHQVVEVARAVTVKYTRSKVRKMLPKQFAYVIEELLHENSIEKDRSNYYNAIIDAIIDTGMAEKMLIEISYLIHALTIDTFHIVGDIFDRGPKAEKIMEVLATIRDYDVQYGNHDIEWMGAAAGNRALIATVLRISIRYANIETLEEGYGINLIPLARLAMEVYGETNCEKFKPKYTTEYDPKDLALEMRMHKAIAIIQFKLEGQLIKRNPEFMMDDRLLLDKIDYKDKTIIIHGKRYEIRC